MSKFLKSLKVGGLALLLATSLFFGGMSLLINPGDSSMSTHAAVAVPTPPVLSPTHNSEQTWIGKLTAEGLNFASHTLAGTGVELDPYIIGDEADLVWLAYRVNNQNIYPESYKDKYIKVADNVDLDLSGFEWTPIGRTTSSSAAYYFAGHFDGNGTTINGMTITKPYYSYGSHGLFGNIMYGSVKNLTLTNAYIKVEQTYSNGGDGLIVGRVRPAVMTASETIPQVFENLHVKSGYISSDKQYVGGLFGQFAGKEINNCTNEAAVYGSEAYVAGIAAKLEASTDAGNIVHAIILTNNINKGTVYSEKTYAAGIVAVASTGISTLTVTGCENSGNIRGNGYTGGIVGSNAVNRSTSSNAVYTNCKNTGNVISESTATSAIRIGGIIGSVTSGDIVITGCINGSPDDINGNVIRSGYEGAAGIVAALDFAADKKLINCINYAKIESASYLAGIAAYVNQGSASFDGCENYGDVEGRGSGSYMGSIVGDIRVATPLFKNCENNGNISGDKSYVGGLVGRSTMVGTEFIECVNNGVVNGGASYIGGVVGYVSLSNAVFTECVNNETVTGNGSYVGGIVGSSASFGSVFTKCINNAKVENTGSYVGGIAGSAGVSGILGTDFIECENHAVVKSSGAGYVGGIAGQVASIGATITDCVNSGNIEGVTAYVSGIVSYMHLESTFTGCSNSGNISTQTGAYVGGIVSRFVALSAHADYSISYATITDCHNTGNILGGIEGTAAYTAAATGGIVGLTDRGIDIVGCSNSGKIEGRFNVSGILGFTGSLSVEVKLKDCNNTGEILASQDFAAGIVGRAWVVNIDNCHNTGAIGASTRPGSNVAGISRAAGLVAVAKGVIKNSSNTGNINALNTASTSGVYGVGGILGSTSTYSSSAGNILIENSFNSGNVTTGRGYVGGIIGFATEALVCEIVSCYNTGNIISNSGVEGYVGGIIGSISSTSTTSNQQFFNIDKCFNSGNIKGLAYVGGIAGRVNVRRQPDSATTGANVSYITNSYNLGSITATTLETTTPDLYLGGIVGYVNFVKHDLYNLLPATLIIDKVYNAGEFIYTTEGFTRIDYVGLLIGRVNFTASAPASLETVAINASYSVAHNSVDAVGSFSYAYTGTNISYSVNADLVKNIEAMRNIDLYLAAGWSISGADAIWGYSSTFNSGLPYLRGSDVGSEVILDLCGGYYNNSERTTFPGEIGDLANMAGLENPSRVGYSFKGWSLTDPNEGPYTPILTGEIIGSGVYLTSRQTKIYACWQAVEYSITNGSGPALKVNGTPVDGATKILTGTSYVVEVQTVPMDGDFIEWRARNVSGEWEVISRTASLELTVDAAFINKYARFVGVGQSLAFYFEAVYAESFTVEVKVPSMQNEYGVVKIDGLEVDYDVTYKIRKNGDAGSFSLEAFAADYHEFVSFTLNGNPLVPGANGYVSIDQNSEIIATFKLSSYSVSVISRDLAGKVIAEDGIMLFPDEIKLGEDLSSIHITGADGFRFIKYTAYSNVTKKMEDLPFLAGGFLSGTVTAEFFNEYLNGTTLEIYAIFAEEFYISVGLSAGSAAKGSLVVNIYDANNALISEYDSLSLVRIEAGYRIEIFAIPSESTITLLGTSGLNFTRVNYKNDLGEDLVRYEARFVVTESVNIEITFGLTVYTLNVEAVDSLGNIIDSINEVTYSIGTSNLDLYENEFNVGDGANTFVREKNTFAKGYRFVGWFLVTTAVDANGKNVEIPLIGIDVEGDLLAQTFSAEYLAGVVFEGNIITIRARYIQYFIISVQNDEEAGNIAITGSKTVVFEEVDNPYEYYLGDVLTITVTTNKYYKFDSFDGVDTEVSDGVATVTMNADRYPSVNYIEKEFNVTHTKNTDNAMGGISFDISKVKIGDTIKFTFNIDGGYDLSSWKVTDFAGRDISSEFSLFGNTITSVIDDEAWFDKYLDVSDPDNIVLKLNVTLTTTMNVTYMTMLLVGGVTIPVMLLVILLLIISNKKRKEEIRKSLANEQTNFARINQADFINQLRLGEEVGSQGKAITDKDVKNKMKK